MKCHNPQKSRGSLDLTTREHLLKGGETGPAVVVGRSDKSLLVEMISGAKPRMPQKGDPLTAEQIATLRTWTDTGVPWSKTIDLRDASKQSIVGPDWWSLRPLSRAKVPEVKDPTWVHNPVDAFILAALEARGLRPSAPADKRTLIRRLTFDLHGLP